MQVQGRRTPRGAVSLRPFSYSCPAVQSLQEAVCTATREQYQALQRACAGPLAGQGSAGTSAGGERLLDEEGSVQLPTAVDGAAAIEQQHLFSVYVHAPPSFPGKPQIHSGLYSSLCFKHRSMLCPLSCRKLVADPLYVPLSPPAVQATQPTACGMAAWSSGASPRPGAPCPW